MFCRNGAKASKAKPSDHELPAFSEAASRGSALPLTSITRTRCWSANSLLRRPLPHPRESGPSPWDGGGPHIIFSRRMSPIGSNYMGHAFPTPANVRRARRKTTRSFFKGRYVEYPFRERPVTTSSPKDPPSSVLYHYLPQRFTQADQLQGKWPLPHTFGKGSPRNTSWPTTRKILNCRAEEPGPGLGRRGECRSRVRGRSIKAGGSASRPKDYTHQPFWFPTTPERGGLVRPLPKSARQRVPARSPRNFEGSCRCRRGRGVVREQRPFEEREFRRVPSRPSRILDLGPTRARGRGPAESSRPSGASATLADLWSRWGSLPTSLRTTRRSTSRIPRSSRPGSRTRGSFQPVSRPRLAAPMINAEIHRNAGRTGVWELSDDVPS